MLRGYEDVLCGFSGKILDSLNEAVGPVVADTASLWASAREKDPLHPGRQFAVLARENGMSREDIKFQLSGSGIDQWRLDDLIDVVDHDRLDDVSGFIRSRVKEGKSARFSDVAEFLSDRAREKVGLLTSPAYVKPSGMEAGQEKVERASRREAGDLHVSAGSAESPGMTPNVAFIRAEVFDSPAGVEGSVAFAENLIGRDLAKDTSLKTVDAGFGPVKVGQDGLAVVKDKYGRLVAMRMENFRKVYKMKDGFVCEKKKPVAKKAGQDMRKVVKQSR